MNREERPFETDRAVALFGTAEGPPTDRWRTAEVLLHPLDVFPRGHRAVLRSSCITNTRTTHGASRANQRPEDLKKLSVEELPAPPEEIRQEIIRVIAKNGGHLGREPRKRSSSPSRFTTSSNAPRTDRLGHGSPGTQSQNSHRSPGGVRTIRPQRGISGFPRPQREPVRPRSAWVTRAPAISAALGMAVARDLSGADHRVHRGRLGTEL